MHHQLACIVDMKDVGICEVKFHILCVCYIKQGVLRVGVFLEVKHPAHGIQHIARCLGIGPNGFCGIAVGQREANLSDEQVFIVVSQYGIAARCHVNIVVLEGCRHPRHVYVVKVEQVEVVSSIA